MTQAVEARVVLDADDVGRAIARMAHEILESNRGAAGLLLLGIPRRGVPLAHRLAAAIDTAEGVPVAVGELDITMYRDDLRRRPTLPVGRTRVPGSVDDRVVVLVDRGHRELPIRADHVGTVLTTKAAEVVDVHLDETDGVTEVVVR